MGKYKYKIKHTGTTGVRVTRFAKTKREAEKVKSNMLKANEANRKFDKILGITPRYRNVRVSKL